MIAYTVLMILRFGNLNISNIELITPSFSSRVCHASVRRRKFIHMGRIKIRIINLLFPLFIPARIIARGYDNKRHIIVLTKERTNEINNALICTG